MKFRSALLFSVVAVSSASAQDSTSGFFKKRDLVFTGIAAVATVALMPFDERIEHWVLRPAIQGDSSRYHLVKDATVVNEVPLTVGSVAIYGIGRITGSHTMADVGLHLTESLVATDAVTEGLRLAFGRARPHVNNTNAFDFRPGLGFTKFDYRSFPSVHAAVAFATAATLSGEIQIRDPGAAEYATPLLYAAATIPGFTRLYLDEHWASDLLSGSFVGALIGTRMVQHQHGHKTWVDRLLLGAIVVPDQHGGTLVGFTTHP